MNIHLFYHSLVSDWNHGNAHFLRGITAELIARGHAVHVHEPADGWSRRMLLAEHGFGPVRQFHAAYPGLRSRFYDPAALHLEDELANADLVIVHEWNDPELVQQIAALRQRQSFVLLYHDTHHRLVTDRKHVRRDLLQQFDGVLAYGEVLRNLYLAQGLTEHAWTWHEAADTRMFHPRPRAEEQGDVVWIGNWGDDERTEELREFLIEPLRSLGVKALIHGVRYPESAKAELAAAGIEYGGWLPNLLVPQVFARFKVTLHVPRRPYVQALPGIPTIRPFEAMACGIPLITSPWQDRENLFHPGRDFLVARDGMEMRRHLADLLAHPEKRDALSAHALATIRSRHTCVHRVDELLAIYNSIQTSRAMPVALVSSVAPLLRHAGAR